VATVSRHGYTDGWDGDEDNLVQGRWAGRLKSATRGKRGQAFFRSLVEALDAMPEKSLTPNSLETKGGSVCALGALARHRGIDVKALELGEPYTEDPDEGSEWQDSDWDKLSNVLNIAPCLAREVMYTNDEAWTEKSDKPGEVRWQKVRAWAARQIVPVEEELGQS
jgi:hypothetical protein